MKNRVAIVAGVLLVVAFASQAAFAGGFGGGRGAARGGHGLGIGAGQPGYEIVAETLKISPDELRDARWDGKSVTQLAEEKGISQEELENAIIAQRKTALDEAVQEGKITQDEADKLLDLIKARVGLYCDDSNPRGSFNRGAFGKGQMPGGPRGFRGGR